MLRRSNLVPIATAAALSLTLAACGGGGTGTSSKSVLPAATSTAPARAADATATLTLKFPAHTARVRFGSSTSGTKRAPAYINPNATDVLEIQAFGVDLIDPSTGQPDFALSEGTVNLTTGVETLTIPLYSGNYNAGTLYSRGDLTITEWDGPPFASDVLAYGYIAPYTDSSGNFQTGSFSLAPGGSASPVVTMVMNAAGIALTSDPVAGSDAIALTPGAPGTNTCGQSNFHNGAILYAFAIDASGTFVVPGQAPGAGLTGRDPNSPFPGVNAATLSEQFVDGGTINLQSTIFGPSVNQLNDPNGTGQMQAEFTSPNPLSQISNLFFPSSSATGWVELGSGFC